MFRISTHLASRLKHHACNSLSDAYNAAVANIALHKVSPSQHESWHVAHLCREIGLMAGNWRAEIGTTMPGVTLNMSSVFTHQSPYVKWNNGSKPNSRCELADLLVVVIDKTGVNPNGYAALIQAKLSKHGTVIPTTPSEKTQFELLTQRPIFDVDAVSSPAQVNLQSKAPDSALLYGLATENPAPHIGLYCHPWWRETWLVEDQLTRFTTATHVTASDCLASMFVGLLQGSYGWQFTMPPPGKNWQYFSSASTRDDWSALVNYLLTDTFGKVLSKGHGIAAGHPLRGQEDVLCLVSSSPNVGKMFFLTNGNGDSHIHNYLGDTENAGSDWANVSYQELMGGDGGLGEFNPNINNDSPDGGPISAIVIEVVPRDE